MGKNWGYILEKLREWWSYLLKLERSGGGIGLRVDIKGFIRDRILSWDDF